MIMYLAGPTKGYPERNYPLFNSVAAKLREVGHRVYNPAEFPNNGTDNFDLRKAFAAYFICLEAEAIMLLPGWEKSTGAQIEYQLAKVCGLVVIVWEEVSW